ncbi:hypothetical protein SUNI508_09003 [Seiridium unicorne]|uniref:Uncharacterized protein n=1 Tax=Seiridium unicorne TaxID=138068 RepID=A0ABR2URC8_9PEZI
MQSMDDAFATIFETPKSHDQTQNIFLIHGFATNKFIYFREVLENWVSKSSRTANKPVLVRAFRFDVTRIIADGSKALLGESKRLRDALMRWVEDSQSEGATEATAAVSTDTRPERSETIFFIAHGLGSWILKDVLASPSSGSITSAPIDVALIDAAVGHNSSDRPYVDYLQRMSNIINLGDSQTLTDRFLRLFWPSNYDKEVAILDSIELFKIIREVFNPVSDEQSTQAAPVNHAVPDSPTRRTFGGQPSSPTNLNAVETWKVGSVPLTNDSDISLFGMSRVDETERHMNAGDAGGAGVAGDARDEVRSVVSETLQPALTSSPENLKLASRLASSFFHRGQLQNAKVLFDQVLRAMEESNPQPIIDIIATRMQITITMMYGGIQSGIQSEDDPKGLYSEALECLDQVLEDINILDNQNESDEDRMRKAEIQEDCRKWRARCMLRAGKWSDSEKLISNLIDAGLGASDEKLHRDLALAYANMGNYTLAKDCIKVAETRLFPESLKDNSEGSSNTYESNRVGNKERPEEKLATARSTELKHIQIRLADATISMFAGEYVPALKISSETVTALKEAIGAIHFRTLAALNLQARCKAYMGEYKEAATLASNTYETVANTLGRRHPLALESMDCLVHVYRAQHRFAEAIATAKSLAENSKKTLGSTHPQTIRADYQVAVSQLAIGDYFTAEKGLRKVVIRAGEHMGENHPEKLEYTSKFAHALLETGKVDEAWEVAMNVAERQAIHYWKPQEKISQPLVYICGRLRGPSNHKDSTLLHPLLATTIQLLATTQTRKLDLKPETELSEARLLLECLQSYFATRHLDGSNELKPSQLSITTDFELAMVLKRLHFRIKEPREALDSIENIAVLLKRVVVNRREALGPDNLETLWAYRELINVRTMRNMIRVRQGTIKRIDWKKLEKRSQQIYLSFDSRLGSYHPRTLTCHLWWFAFAVLNESKGSKQIEEKSKEILQILSTPGVTNERLVESMQMRNALADLLVQAGYKTFALELLEPVKHRMKPKTGKTDPNEDNSLSLILENLDNCLEASMSGTENP